MSINDELQMQCFAIAVLVVHHSSHFTNSNDLLGDNLQISSCSMLLMQPFSACPKLHIDDFLGLCIRAARCCSCDWH